MNITAQDKDLLLRDLCARLYTGTIVNYNDTEGCNYPLTIGTLSNFPEEKLKCYLRPISSITEEEERELNGLLSEVYDFTFRMDELLELIQMQKEIPFHYIDWLNAHHFDYRGLIPMGLALEAPEGMYQIN